MEKNPKIKSKLKNENRRKKTEILKMGMNLKKWNENLRKKSPTFGGNKIKR